MARLELYVARSGDSGKIRKSPVDIAVLGANISRIPKFYGKGLEITTTRSLTRGELYALAHHTFLKGV